jgi:hypothetical protein
MNTISIANITRKDFERKQIRLLAAQKALFPAEQPGFPKKYDVIVTWKAHFYHCVYRVGSKDGRAGSGVLLLKNGLSEDLGDWVGKTSHLKRLNNNKYSLTTAGL